MVGERKSGSVALKGQKNQSTFVIYLQCLSHRPVALKVVLVDHQRCMIHSQDIQKIVFCINKNVPLYCVHYLHQQKL